MGCSILCYGPNSCKASSVNTSFDLQCDEDSSCKGSASLISSNFINCGGPQSCKDVQLMQALNAITCSAENSCSNVGMIRIEDGALKFSAKQAGAGSTMYNHIFEKT